MKTSGKPLMTFHYTFYLSFIRRKHHKSASRKRINRVWEAETIGVSRQISWSIVWIILFCSRPVVSLNTISPPLLLHNSEVNLFNREQPPNRLLVAITAHQSQFSFGIQSIHTSDSQLSLLKIWSCDPFISQHLCAEMLFLICQFSPKSIFLWSKM